MGGCLSCRSSSSFDGIRVVHQNGFVEEFDYPVTVSEITGKPPKHFVCTMAQLHSFGSKPALAPDTQLQPGQLYFVLPFSVFQSDASPVDLVSLATRLTAIAKRGVSASDARHPENSPMSRLNISAGFRSNSAPASANSFWDRVTSSVAQEADLAAYRCQTSTTARSWKPILETINEKSFHRCESDLQSKRFEVTTQ
ncbi:PREDICTED: uncharacterized protein LOC104611744 [Nelumbo nucifera]|uniref:DUF4228 domain-containing protein n=2 Tax=Nelumbo nucifera TaxID=4432 RepID=A0A822ZNI6_NELNU|nr:PREDICTED: uncharacterized protein LOC104611744 [Nelumbo nucifera]DAD46020.1 TPA_asm: hypothetical protein HUJ06_004251 [Nelumbo nucifera]